jgi:hypothetical protein
MTTRLVQNPNQMKVLDLREELKRRGLSPSGLKSTLVKRLLQAMAEEGVNIEAFAQPEMGVGEIYAENATFKGKCKRFALSSAISECIASPVQVPTAAFIWFFAKDKDVLLFHEKEPFTVRVNPLNPGDPRQLGLHNFAATAVGKKLIVFGGKVGHKYVNTVYEIDPETRIWQQQQCSGSAPCPREGHTLTEINDEEVIVFGGRTMSGGAYFTLAEMHILNLSTWTWREIIPDGIAPSPRAGHCAIKIRHDEQTQLIVFGGMRYPKDGTTNPYDAEWLSDIYLLDFVDMTSPVWTKLQTRGEAVQCRAFHSGVFLNNKLYIFGGCNKVYGNWQFPNYVDYLDLDTLIWQRLQMVENSANFETACSVRLAHCWSLFPVSLQELLALTLKPNVPSSPESISSTFSSQECHQSDEKIPSYRCSEVYVINIQYEPIITLFKSTLSLDLRNLLYSESFSDINFRVQNKYIRAHKAIVSSKSDALRDLCNKKKKRGQTITIEGVKYLDFRIFLKLLYVGQAKVKTEQQFLQVQELLKKYHCQYKVRKVYEQPIYIFTTPTNSLRTLYCDASTADIRLIVEGKVFFAHKAILSARSCVFHAILQTQDTSTSSVSETTRNDLHIDNVPAELFEILLKTIYDGYGALEDIEELTRTRQRTKLEYLLSLAHEHRMLDLKLPCEKALLPFITPDTVLDIYQLSCRCEAVQLREVCLHRIIPIFHTTLQTTESYLRMDSNLRTQLHQKIVEVLNRHYVTDWREKFSRPNPSDVSKTENGAERLGGIHTTSPDVQENPLQTSTSSTTSTQSEFFI